MRDTVSRELHAAVLARDGVCFLYRLDHGHICRDRWNRSHGPGDRAKLTVDHVKDAPALGKRAPSDPAHLVAMCFGGNVGVPSKAVRIAEREYLTSLVPEIVA